MADPKAALDKALLNAHENGDLVKLVELYSEAAENAEKAADLEAACFYYTHALVFALESGDEQESSIRKFLVQHGREELV